MCVQPLGIQGIIKVRTSFKIKIYRVVKHAGFKILILVRYIHKIMFYDSYLIS